MKLFSDDQIREALAPYDVSPDHATCYKITTYVEILLKWNKSIALTTIIQPIEVLRFHFGESLFAVSAAGINRGRLADVGSGAGFPGLPLAIFAPALRVTLIESNLKKCAFLAEVCRALEASNVEIFRTRMEEIPDGALPCDFVTARALGIHEELLRWAQAHLGEAGHVALWVGEMDAETISKKHDWKWRERILIPGSSRRYLLVGSPEK